MLLISAAASRAGIIYSSLGPSDSYNNARAWAIGGVEQAFAFQSSDPYILTSLRFPAVTLSGTGDVIASLRSGSVPGSPIESFTVNVSRLASMYTVVSVLHPTLSPGTTYWMALAAANPATDLVGWFQNDQLIVGNRATSSDSVAWTLSGNQSLAAFEVSGDPVPEPSSLILVGPALGLFLFARFKR